MSASQLLSIEVLVNAFFALLLLAMPRLLTRMLGWPPAETAFWQRLFGGLLAGVALATLTTLMRWSHDGHGAGIGLAGHIVINMTMALVLFTILFLGPHAPTLRGRIATGVLAGLLLLLALVEIAYV